MTIDDREWKKLMKRLGKSNRRVKVGVFASAGGHDGISMVELMAIHEFGSPAANIDERAPIRSTFEGNEREHGQISRKLARQMILEGMTIDQAMEVLGAWGANAVKATITQGPSLPPELKAATIKRKGSSRALVDTGRLVGSITWELD